MLADTVTDVLETSAGDRMEVVLTVTNTSAVIDGVTARVIGLPDGVVTPDPALLPLFPDASGQMRLGVEVPPSFPAGAHPITVEVVSHGAGAPSQFLDVLVRVAANASFRVSAAPRRATARGRRRGRYVLEVQNTGNVTVAATLEASDTDRAATVVINPHRLVVPPSTTAAVLVSIRGPRLLFGSDVERAVTIGVAAEIVPLPGSDPDDAPETLPVQTVALRLRQRPRVGRGLLTALILASIVALWAAAVLFGLDRVLAGDPQTKSAPASFFAASAAAAGPTGAAGSAGGAAPAGALPKNGSVPAGVGGSITGTITGTSNEAAVGRILVEAVRMTPRGPQVASAAASQTDGAFTIAGLFPTAYLVKVSAPGYAPVWYPEAPDSSTARLVRVAAQSTSEGIDVVVTGDPASVSGTVDVGDTRAPVPVTVTARPLQSIGSEGAPISTTTDATGAYTMANLPAPASYEITFTAPGYQPTAIVDQVGGGQHRIEPAVTLSVGAGTISGSVTDGTTPLGGATVTVVVAGQSRSVTTPTAGAVGTFSLSGLPTPQTYVVSVSRADFGSATVVVDLGGGASRAGLTVVILSGTGSVAGQVVGVDGRGVGGATVTVGGSSSGGDASTVPTTTTLTTPGSEGTFTLSGLVPGSYTLTFSLGGYTPTTVPVTLRSDVRAGTVRAVLARSSGRLTGTVMYDGPRVVTVTVSSGATSASTTIDLGGDYLIDDLPPGVYSVTAAIANGPSATVLVEVSSGPTTSAPTLVLTE